MLKKGSLAGVDGCIQTRNYEGQDGKRVYVTEVVAESVQFLEPRKYTKNTNITLEMQEYPVQITTYKGSSFSQDDGRAIESSDKDLPF